MRKLRVIGTTAECHQISLADEMDRQAQGRYPTKTRCKFSRNQASESMRQKWVSRYFQVLPEVSLCGKANPAQPPGPKAVGCMPSLCLGATWESFDLLHLRLISIWR